MPKCKACDVKFDWNDVVVIVNDECYHKDCLTLGEVENDEGEMAFNIFDELILEDD